MFATTIRRLTIITGITVLGPELARFSVENVAQYLAFSILAVLAAYFRVGIRYEQGHIPLSLLFVLLSLMNIEAPATLCLAAVAAFIVEWVSRDGPGRMERSLFGGSAMVIAIAMAQVAYVQTVGTGGVHLALRYVLTSTVLFMGLTFPATFVEASEENRRMGSYWKERYLWMLPYYIGLTVMSALFTAASEVFHGWQIPFITCLAGYLVYRSYRLYMGRLEDGRAHAEEVASLHLRTIEALALAIDAKDETTHDHLQRVQVYAVEIGRELGLSTRQIEAVRAASLLHDIGKLAVPEHIISKPGRLTAEEFEKMKIHPVVGAEILERVKFPYPVVPIVRSHHEKWDGSGYPDGLKAEDIPIGARIISAVDCLDALCTDRQYRRALPLDRAIGVVVQEAGRSFDPRVVEVLARRYQDLERMAKASAGEPLRLSKDLKVSAGEAPAAGFVGEGGQTSMIVPEGAEFLQKIAAARQEAQALFELAQNLGSSLSIDETLSVVAVRMRRLIPFDSMAVYIRRDNQLEPQFVSGDNMRLFASLCIPVGQGLSGWVAENGRPILNGNPSVEPGYLNDPTKFSSLRAALAVPLEGVQSIVGVLALYHAERDAFSRDHLRILQAVSSKIALAVENALKFKQAETSAVTDFLTGLPNARSLFLQLDAEIARCQSMNLPLAVLVCDVDNFKQINDELGHLEGNKALKAVAGTLVHQCRETDYVARMGGDEFVLLLPGMPKDRIAERIERMQRMVLDYTRAETGMPLSVSIGSASLPEDGTDAESLLATADRSMYVSKGVRQRASATLLESRLAQQGAGSRTVN
ncbi:MAG: diguanylate cyclase [Bryobacteraceae bacterium]|nr:diguanylate cyclase [Bryobacteraceae bacterium]